MDEEGPVLPEEAVARWLKGFQTFAKDVRETEDSAEVLEIFLHGIMEASSAQGASAYLESLGPTWLCELTAGPLGQPLGTEFSTTDERMKTILEGQAVVVPPQGTAGPRLLVPLQIAGEVAGVMVLEREVGGRPFLKAVIPPATSFALQATMALDLLDSKDAENQEDLLEERERIGRDLHDLAIQGLFATGMKLRGIPEKIPDKQLRRKIGAEVEQALAALDDSVHQIRQIVYRLKNPKMEQTFVSLLSQEAATARTHLGFAPTLVVEVDDQPLGTPAQEGTVREDLALEDSALAGLAHERTQEVTGQVLAVVREGLANIAKHADATSASVQVSVYGRGKAGEIVVKILDDGKGIDPEVNRESGIANMQRRAYLLGGSFSVGTGLRGRGTALVWRVPLA